MAELHAKRDPSAVALEKGLSSLIAGLRAQHPGTTFRVTSPKEGLKGSGAVGTGHVDAPRVVGPDDERPLLGAGVALAADEDVMDRPRQEVA